tara:strand:- start:43 stop:249 length:207 start_codon:yes stop_codon:yes gene_type:complete
MVLKNIPKEEAKMAAHALKQALDTVLEVGDRTHIDRRTNRSYVNIVIEIGHLKSELTKYFKKEDITKC